MKGKVSELLALVAKTATLRAHLAKKPMVVETKDVPDTAGYSKQPRAVFIDRHLAAAAPVIDGKPYAVWRQALVDHEWMEKGLVDLGYTYAGAHEFASMWEDITLRRLGMKPAVYNRDLKPFIRRDEIEQITLPPIYLDCTPYRGPNQTSADKAIMARFRALGVRDAA